MSWPAHTDRLSADIVRPHRRRGCAVPCRQPPARLAARVRSHPGQSIRCTGARYVCPCEASGSACLDRPKPPGCPTSRTRASAACRWRQWPGRRSSVKPCSRPLGPFTYHSVSAPRLYSTRFAAPPGLVRGAFRSLSPYPYARRSMPHSSAPFRKLTPPAVKSAVTPRPALVMRRPPGPATKWYADKSLPITDETCACAAGESVLTAAPWSTPVARIEWIGVP